MSSIPDKSNAQRNLIRENNGNVYLPYGMVNATLLVENIPNDIELTVQRKNIDLVFEVQDKDENEEAAPSNDSSLVAQYYQQFFALEPFENDISTITIASQKKSGDTNSTNDNVNLNEEAKLKIKTYGRYKIDFSSGFAFSGFFAPDKNYYLTAVEGGEAGSFQINNGKRDNFSFPTSVAAMLHVYQTWARRWTIGGSVGLGIDEDGTEFFAGLGAMLGEQQRFVISAGVVLRKVKDLKPNYSAGDFVELSEEQSIDDLMTEYYRPDFGSSLTYNLTAKEK